MSLITAAIVHWNTVYLDRAVQHSPRPEQLAKRIVDLATGETEDSK